MNPLVKVWYWVRAVWFHFFPRKVGYRGSEPATAPNLPESTSLPVAPKSWTSPRIKWKMFGNGPDPANVPAFPNGVGDCVVAGLLEAIRAVGAFLKLPDPNFTTPQAI